MTESPETHPCGVTHGLVVEPHGVSSKKSLHGSARTAMEPITAESDRFHGWVDEFNCTISTGRYWQVKTGFQTKAWTPPLDRYG